MIVERYKLLYDVNVTWNKLVQNSSSIKWLVYVCTYVTFTHTKLIYYSYKDTG